MFSIDDYGLDFYISKHCQQEYENIANSSLPLDEKISHLLTINPGFMKKVITDEEAYKQAKYNTSLNLLRNKIQENKRLEFFSLSFNTKPQIKEITNGIIYPDVADFLTLLHLNLMFKHINNIYPTGATLRIGVEFNYFRKFARIEQDTAINMFNIIEMFNKTAEKMTNSYGNIELYDIYDEVESFKKEFFLKIEAEKLEILQQDQSMELIKSGAEYYMNYVIDVKQFPNKEAAWNFCMYHTLDAFAYKNTVGYVYDTEQGLFERYSQIIKAENRFQSGSNISSEDTIYIAFLPGAATFSYNRLTINNESDLWEQSIYSEIIKNNAKEVFVKELTYPFFFKVDNNG
ncbi:hypothetical protein [Bacillus toyonensis]|uniref:hypothetical protein n=1 Tax=Bacillus toyonensis TaxID=155322 RepID=UPI002E1CC55C|nr:hypothetical protein [Bacillus toyonensis]